MLKFIKVHRTKEKDQEFHCDECEYKCSKRNTQDHRNDTEIKLKTEET